MLRKQANQKVLDIRFHLFSLLKSQSHSQTVTNHLNQAARAVAKSTLQKPFPARIFNNMNYRNYTHKNNNIKLIITTSTTETYSGGNNGQHRQDNHYFPTK
jgi:hypothetical protein